MEMAIYIRVSNGHSRAYLNSSLPNMPYDILLNSAKLPS